MRSKNNDKSNNKKPSGFYVLSSKFKSHSSGYTKWDWIDAFLLFIIIFTFFPLAIYLIYKRWSIFFRYQQEERKKEEQEQIKKWREESKEKARREREKKKEERRTKKELNKALENLEKQHIKAKIDAEENLKTKIILFLKNKALKIPASEIDAFLKHQNVDEIKALCEEMYHNGEISRTANYRYFILTEEKKKPKFKKASAPKSEAIDVEKELEKLKGLLSKGLITQEQYDAKSNKLLGL